MDKDKFFSRFTKVTIAGNQVLLIKPQTFMNLSGQAVQAVTAYYKIAPEQLLVIYDDLDLVPGTVRLRPGGSAGGHKGLTSIIQHLGTQAIPRLRIGIGKPGPGMAVPDYVLSSFSGPERLLFQKSIARASDTAIAYISHGLDYAMNHFNGSVENNPSE